MKGRNEFQIKVSKADFELSATLPNQFIIPAVSS